MKTILIDTSHSLLAVGLYDGTSIVASKQDTMNKKQSEFLLRFVDDLMQSVNWKPADLEALVITDGPGSYTGMRIGITFAKTLCLVNTSMKVYTVDTLLSLSGLAEGFAFIDARSGRTFGGFVKDGQIQDERVYLLEDVKTIQKPFFGDVALLSEPQVYGDVIQNMIAVQKSWVAVEDPDLLVPRYIK